MLHPRVPPPKRRRAALRKEEQSEKRRIRSTILELGSRFSEGTWLPFESWYNGKGKDVRDKNDRAYGCTAEIYWTKTSLPVACFSP